MLCIETHSQILSHFLSGGPGSGRTTQCKQLELYTNFCHISSGDVLRNEVMSESDRSLNIYTCMFNGNPVPDEVKCEIIEEEMISKRMKKDRSIKVGD